MELRPDERPLVLVETVLASDVVEPCERIVGVPTDVRAAAEAVGVVALDSSCGMLLTT